MIVELPVVLSGDVAITEVLARFDALSLGAGDGNDELVSGEVEVAEVNLAEGAEEFAEGFGENLEPAGADVGVGEPGDSLFAILGGVDRGGRVEAVELKEDLFGAARGSEPVAN